MGNRSAEIAEAVTRAIVDKRLWPGSKLSEQSLADLFAVSRAVVRQAIIRLANDGLVELQRNKGASVIRPGYRDAVEIYDALTILEQGVAAQLAGRIGPRGWAELREHVQCQHAAVEAKDDARADALGWGFHAELVKLSRNSVVRELHTQLLRRTALLRTLVDSRFDYCGLLHDHSELIDLLEAGNVAEAQALIERHHRAVVSGFILDEDSAPAFSVQEALAPYAAASVEPRREAAPKEAEQR
ncbi:GntR family transcriptional regulator [Sulfitobacter aestuarii]|uniref:GntR family transcriptional regulator n=1 Tax=Sulfitobacter aestuarii TaxID=2161676 RepID=A0ABW5U1B7_9RHOB